VVLLAHQLVRRVAGEDQYGISRRFALFQQRVAPFGAGGAADFQRQRVVANHLRHLAQRVVAVLRQAVIMPTRPFLMDKSFYGQIKISLFNPLINKMAGIPA